MSPKKISHKRPRKKDGPKDQTDSLSSEIKDDPGARGGGFRA